MISRLLGFTQKSCGATISMSGGTLSIEGEGFCHLSFHHKPEKKIVYVELYSVAESPMDSDYVERMSELMKIGTGCFVYEQISREYLHA
jgi:hypothetical protein